MAGKDIVQMGKKEFRRLKVIHDVQGKLYTQGEAGEKLGLSDRQVRRILVRVSNEGERGLVHRLCGRASNRGYPQEVKDKVLGLYEERYSDFGPTLASEKLYELNKISINDETLRLWLIGAKKWEGRRKGRKHRKWRERRHRRGELVQLDGSHHKWLEDRGSEIVMMGYIDDATGEVYARFYEYEGTMPAMDSFKRYIKKYGLPECLYFDKHTTYKSPKKPTVEDELLNQESVSEFGRALKELGVDFIHAHSPQAKGRVERLFRTFQDRLIKEMRLANICTLEEANRFMDRYLPIFNRKFMVQPVHAEDGHRAVPQGMNLDGILCRKKVHPLRNDYTVIHEGRVYQVLVKTRARRVMVEERLNGKVYVTYNGTELRCKEIPRQRYSAPRKHKAAIQVRPRTQKSLIPYKPPHDHPWRLAAAYAKKMKQLRKEKEAKRNERNGFDTVVKAGAHVKTGGKPLRVSHTFHNRLDNPAGYPQFSQRGGYCSLKKSKPDISTLVKSGHF